MKQARDELIRELNFHLDQHHSPPKILHVLQHHAEENGPFLVTADDIIPVVRARDDDPPSDARHFRERLDA